MTGILETESGADRDRLRRVRPRDAELRDVGLVDLIERRVARGRAVAAVRAVREDVHASGQVVVLDLGVGDRREVRQQAAGPEGRKPFQLDKCHALVTTGAAVAKFYPRWYRGAEPHSLETDTEQGGTR